MSMTGGGAPGAWPDRFTSKSTPRKAELAAKASRVEDEPEEDTWLEIELVDEEDNPVPGEQYQVELPDGSIRTGQLDDNGLARIKGLDPGSCKVTFPDLDESVWERY